MVKKTQRKVAFFVLACLLIASLVVIGIWYKSRSSSPGNVIIVSGVSSSGKSTLVNALQETLGKQSTVVRLDEFFQKIVDDKACKLGWNAHSRVGAWDFLRSYVDDEVNREVFDYEIRANMLSYQRLYDAIAIARKKYRYVLVDTIVESDAHYNQLVDAAAGSDVLWVLLYCPLTVVANRLLSRDTVGSFVRDGISLATYESFMAMFAPRAGVSWQPLDALAPQKTRDQLDAAIAMLLAKVSPREYVQYQKHTHAFRNRFLHHFGLAEPAHNVVQIYPAFRFDVVLNSNSATPQDLVKQVLGSLKH